MPGIDTSMPGYIVEESKGGERQPIDVDAINDPSTLKSVLRAQQERTLALERRLAFHEGNKAGATAR